MPDTHLRTKPPTPAAGTLKPADQYKNPHTVHTSKLPADLLKPYSSIRRTKTCGEEPPASAGKKVENRLTTMCRNAKEASDKTGKANRKSRIADVRALQKNTNLHKIGRRIELQNPNGREIRLGFNEVTPVACRLSTGVNSEKKDKGVKSSRTLLHAKQSPAAGVLSCC